MTSTISTGRKTKAALCAAAAFALLLGGGSTYAAWSEQAAHTPTGVQVDTGGWTFTLGSTTQWYDISPETGAVPVAIDLATFPLVPGDVIKGVSTVTMAMGTVEGEHLEAEVSAVDIQTGASVPVTWLDVDASVSGDELTVTIAFPYDATNAYTVESGEHVAVDLGTLTVTVTQVRAALD
ncbi:MAG: alternate-type signal peptide domain-containing protein [Micrococcales bacterium]|nr:alternate-type signal peptide domain-containing protein [Micrococcales bacterium]